MIYCIVAFDEKQGMANEQGIPWLGKIPADMAMFREKTLHHPVIMGYRTYEELKQPLGDRINLVITKPGTTPLRPGFVAIEDAEKYLQEAKEDVWVIGGAGVFAQLVPLADELHLTVLEGDFNCTKFFPPFKDSFERIYRGDDTVENGMAFHFEVWKNTKKSANSQ